MCIERSVPMYYRKRKKEPFRSKTKNTARISKTILIHCIIFKKKKKDI